MKTKALSVLFAVLMLMAAFSVSALAEDEAVAKIGEASYASLEDAVAAVPADGTETTVTLLRDATGNGIIVKEGQNVVIDFGGFTYYADGDQVGSAGTETLSFQLLKGATVTLRNGTVTSTKTKMLVQNYSDLTLEDITLDGTQSDVNQYTLSNNFGEIVIRGETNILGDEDTVAFDLWYGMFAAYDDGVSVIFDETFTGKVEGAVEYGAHSRVTAEGWQEKAPLVIKAGNFDVDFVAVSDVIENASITISGGKFTAPVREEFCAEGYEPAEFDEGVYGVCKHAVKKVTESKEKTCLENGYDKIECTQCNYTIVIDYVSTGHSFTVYTSDNNATYFADGTKTAYCDYGCGESETVADNGSMRVLGKTDAVTAVPGVKTMTLQWEAVEDATGYRLYYYNKGWKKIREVSDTTYKVSALSAGKKYSFAVKAYLSDGTTTLWAPTYTTLTVYTRPEPPVKVIASSRMSDSLTLNWSKCTGATGYRIYVKTEKGWKTVRETTEPAYTVTRLKANTSYTFAIKPYIKYGSTVTFASKYTTFTVATPYLDTPTLKVASTAAGRATLAWSNIDGETGYQIYYSTEKSTGFKKLTNSDADTKKIYKTGLESGKTYYFRVRAYAKVDGKYVYSDLSPVKALTIK